MSKTRRYGLIGAGMMGQEYVTSLALVEGAVLAAMADPHQASLDQAKQFLSPHQSDAKAYLDYQEMIAAEELDALIIVTPNNNPF